MAEGVVGKAAEAANGVALTLDSAGVSDWHQGEAPDKRAQAICAKHGIDITKQKSRPVRDEDFNRFDLILAMDQSNLDALHKMRPKKSRAEIKLFLSYAPHLDHRDVPDPYYDGERGFAKVLAMIEQAAQGLMQAPEIAGR